LFDSSTVETKEGVVTLAGKAKNAAEKDLATKFVSDVHGVKKVVNNMTVQLTVSWTDQGSRFGAGCFGKELAGVSQFGVHIILKRRTNHVNLTYNSDTGTCGGNPCLAA
jgi:hypothetical protein